MAGGSWLRAVVAGAAVVSLGGCGKADPAVLEAPTRPEGDSARPVRVNGLPGIRRIAAHGFTGYAIDTSGGLWAWGSGLTLGGHASRSARPVRVPLPGPALDVSGHHAIVRAGRTDDLRPVPGRYRVGHGSVSRDEGNHPAA